MTKDKPGKHMRVALYARVSTVGHGQDVGLQLDELHQVASQRDWKVAEEYVDEGISGSKATRPALDRMMEDARLGKLDLVVCWKLDRLGRSLQHLLAVLDELTEIGVGFAAIRDSGIDTTSAQGRLLLCILGSFASYERELVRERIMAGLERARRQGRNPGRPRRDVDVDRALQLLDEGRTQRQVAMALKVPRSTLRRALERHRQASQS